MFYKIRYSLPVRHQMDAWKLGFWDGRTQRPFSSGMTWHDNDDANESYDRGVNAGQISKGWF